MSSARTAPSETPTAVRDADGVGLKDVSRLIVRELAPFHVIGIVSELDLHRVIDPARDLPPLFRTEHGKKTHGLRMPLVCALGLFRVLGHIPRLSREESSGDPALCTIVPDAALGDAPLLGGLRNRNETHITPHFPRSGRLLRRLDIQPLSYAIIITRYRQNYKPIMRSYAFFCR